MGLSDDQRALLRLLAGREEGYEDIAALKGRSVDEVRAEVKEALALLQAEGDEKAEAPAVARPAAPAPVEEPVRAETPVEEPKAPAEPTEPEPKANGPAAKPSPGPAKGRPLAGLPPERRRLLLLAGGALAVVAVVIGAIAIFSNGSGSDSGGSSTEASALGAGTAAAAESGKVTQAVLAPADGSDASGRAVFGKVGKEEIVLQVTAEGLQPTEKGQSYTVWLYRSPKLSLRVGSVPVGDSGNLGARFTIPAELLAYVASGAFDQIYVSRTSNAAYQQEVARAKKEKSLPRYTGETVLSGEITGPVAKR
jgi:hypothetical protein